MVAVLIFIFPTLSSVSLPEMSIEMTVPPVLRPITIPITTVRKNSVIANKITRDFVRFFLSGAVEEETDKQGRFLLPANLREYASLTKDAVIIGVGTRIEIWDKKKWNEYNSEENLSVDSIAEKMTELGILGI